MTTAATTPLLIIIVAVVFPMLEVFLCSLWPEHNHAAFCHDDRRLGHDHWRGLDDHGLWGYNDWPWG